MGLALWASGTNGQGSICFLKMQTDCNLVMYNKYDFGDFYRSWASDTVDPSDRDCRLFLNTTALVIVGSTGTIKSTLYSRESRDVVVIGIMCQEQR